MSGKMSLLPYPLAWRTTNLREIYDVGFPLQFFNICSIYQQAEVLLTYILLFPPCPLSKK